MLKHNYPAGSKLGVCAFIKAEGRRPMNGFKILLLSIAAVCVVASPLFADIYEWTDAEGVKHYSNYAPPENARILMKTKEEPYNEAADRARAEAERQQQLESARLELAQKQAELELREAEAERRLAEADRLAAKALRNAESYNEEAENSGPLFQSYDSGCYDYSYGCSDLLYGRWYYRNETASIYFKKPPFATPYRSYRYQRRYDDHFRDDYRYPHRPNTFVRPKAYHMKNDLHSRDRNIPGGSRIGLPGVRVGGQSGFSGRPSAIGRRR